VLWKRKPRQKVTLGRSFQLVKEGQPYADTSGWTAEIVGSVFLAYWWWIVGIPEDALPPDVGVD
jgi:hypothetical protein